MTTDTDRQRAADLLSAWVQNGQVEPVAAALAAERAHAVQPFVDLAAEMRGVADDSHGRVNGFYFADRIRAAAQEAGQ